MNFDEAKFILEKYGQTHILKSYERLNSEDKEKLLNLFESGFNGD